MSLALTTPALMDSVPNVNGLKLTMRLKNEGELPPSQLQTSASDSDTEKEAREKQTPQFIEDLIHWFNFKGSHTSQAMPVVVEDKGEEGLYKPMTDRQRRIMLYVEDGLNPVDAKKLDDEMNLLDDLLKDELRGLDIEQRTFYKLRYKDQSQSTFSKEVAEEFDEEEDKGDELSKLRQDRISALKQKYGTCKKAESKSRE